MAKSVSREPTAEVRESVAHLRYLRSSPTKIRPVLKLIIGRDISLARDTLYLCPRSVSNEIQKLLNSAVANAENNDNVPEDELFVVRAYADEGAIQKRWRPRARGRAGRINKRTSHITIAVARFDEEELERRREFGTQPTARRRSTRRPVPADVPEVEEAEIAEASAKKTTRKSAKKTKTDTTKKAAKKTTAKKTETDTTKKAAKKTTAKKTDTTKKAAKKTTAKKTATKSTKKAAKKPTSEKG